jgi:hypothetical protein
MLHRRDLVRRLPIGLGLCAGLGLPGLARGAVPANGRRFLFIFADGGWDPTWVFNPAFDNAAVDMPDDGSEPASAGGLSWVSGPGRPSVDELFRRYPSRCCLINGLEVRSIAHDRCTRLLLTGSASADGQDLPSRIAAGSPEHLPLRHVVLSGPAFVHRQSSGVVRVGTNGQLVALLDGSCVVGAEPALRLPSDALVSLEDAYIRARIAGLSGSAGQGAEARILGAYGTALDDLDILRAAAAGLSLEGGESIDQLWSAVELLSSGLSRTAMVADRGFLDGRWDHHSEITRQAPSFEGLFANLLEIVEGLNSTPGTWGNSLLDEVTIVVCSEMGRAPRVNSSLGKDHWMTTSLLLIGGGIAGGQVIGAFNEANVGTAVVGETGELDPDGALGGTVLEPAHVGAALLELAGLDPIEAFGADVAPLRAMLAL